MMDQQRAVLLWSVVLAVALLTALTSPALAAVYCAAQAALCLAWPPRRRR
jgi:hypothetical protein